MFKNLYRIISTQSRHVILFHYHHYEKNNFSKKKKKRKKKKQSYLNHFLRNNIENDKRSRTCIYGGFNERLLDVQVVVVGSRMSAAVTTAMLRADWRRK